MRMFIEKGLCIGLILFAFSFLVVSCAKNIGDEGVQNVAGGVKAAMVVIANDGLKLLAKYAPEDVVQMKLDMETLSITLQLYMDGVISVGDVRTAVVGVLTSLDARTSFIGDDMMPFVSVGLTLVSSIASSVLDPVNVSHDVAIYVGAIKAGLDEGLAKYNSGS